MVVQSKMERLKYLLDQNEKELDKKKLELLNAKAEEIILDGKILENIDVVEKLNKEIINFKTKQDQLKGNLDEER